MSFEYAIRPFQSPDVHGRVIVPSSPSATPERATLTWGSTHAATGTIPTAKSMGGTNTKCCKETINEQERAGDTIKIAASNEPENYIMVNRAREVKLKKKDDNSCDDWLKNNSYVAAGIIEAFSEMASLIHASDGAFLPTGSTPGCDQTLKLQPNTTP